MLTNETFNVKKYFQDFHNIFSFVKSTLIIYLVEITYYFEFLMIK